MVKLPVPDGGTNFAGCSAGVGFGFGVVFDAGFAGDSLPVEGDGVGVGVGWAGVSS